MKNILISQKILQDKNNQILFSIEGNWNKFFNKTNVNLISLNLNDFDKKKIDLLNPKGLILHGGNDLPKHKKEKHNVLRKKIDKFLFKYALRKKIPILAVCYGFQFIADFYGIKLSKKSKHVRTIHTLKLNRFFKKKYYKKIVINSYHNYVVKKLPKNFNFISRCFDESIELAISDKNKILCVMFHPERKNRDQRIVKKLVLSHLGAK